MFTTRDGMRNWLQEVSTWVAFTLMLLATVMSVTVVLMPLGMWFFFGGAAVFVAGLGLSWLVPRFWRYRPATCPHCSRLNQVRLGKRQFLCSNCARPVRIRAGYHKGKGLLVLLPQAGTPCRPEGDSALPVNLQGGDLGV